LQQVTAECGHLLPHAYSAAVALAVSALSLLWGYSQRQLTTFHFGCSPTHCAM